MPDAFKGQKYNSLKKACLKKGELFEDPEFRSNNKSLFYSKQDKDIEWKRPKEICKVPRLVVDGVSTDDLNEGELGNTWFVSACSSLAQEPKMWQRVVPNVKDQEWGADDTKYAGIFHFNFWRYGRWIDVIIDDKLPTKNGKLVFCHSKSKNEFWSALLEKAYAKLYGDYESLAGGYTADALVDFTGGVADKLDIKSDAKDKTKFFNNLKTAVETKALVNVSIACGQNEVGQEGNKGLIKGHAYGITDVKEIKLNKGMKAALGSEILHLVRLKNPWGTKEWSGAWSDDSPEWKTLNQKDREKIGIKFQREGEFWMNYQDFLDNFNNLDICHFVNTKIFSLKKSWSESLLFGEWLTGAKGTYKDRAGGDEKSSTFLWNPQFAFDVGGEEDTVMISMEQDDVVLGKQSGEGNNVIGFHIMRVETNRKYRVHIPGEKVAVSEYKQSRNVFLKSSLRMGRYVVIPSTDKPGIAGKFLLRVYTSASHVVGQKNGRPLKKECPESGMCTKAPAIVTRIDVVKATGLEAKIGKETTDPYAIVKCEGESVKGWFQRETTTPTWHFQSIFYRKKPDAQPVIIEIWNKNKILKDEFMGMCTMSFVGTETPEEKEMELYGKGKKEADIQKPGKLFVEVTSCDDLAAL